MCSDLETSVARPPEAAAAQQTANDRRLDYLVVIGLLCVSGNPAFSSGPLREASLMGGAVALIALLVYRGVAVTRGAALTGIYFAALLILQCLSFQFFPFTTIVGFMIRLTFAYLAVRVVIDFPRIYVNVMYGVALVALGFWAVDNALSVVGVRFSDFFGPLPFLLGGDKHLHVVVFNFRYGTDGFPFRNAGMFWEPGALAGYAVLGMILLGLRKEDFSAKQYWVRLAVFLVCLLSTRSTMGYLVTGPALVLHLTMPGQARRSVPGVPASLALLLLLPIGLAVWNADFMARKINVQLDRALTRGRGWQATRIGSLLFDMEYISQRPMLGWGVNRTTRYMLHPGTELHKSQGNGLSDFTAKFGLLGLAGFCFTSWVGLTGAAGGKPLRGAIAVLLVLVTLNGETFLNHPAFLALMFLADSRGMPAPSGRAAIRHEPAAPPAPAAGMATAS